MKKENLTDEHLIFQDAAKAFFEKEMKPNNEQWEKRWNGFKRYLAQGRIQ